MSNSDATSIIGQFRKYNGSTMNPFDSANWEYYGQIRAPKAEFIKYCTNDLKLSSSQVTQISNNFSEKSDKILSEFPKLQALDSNIHTIYDKFNQSASSAATKYENDFYNTQSTLNHLKILYKAKKEYTEVKAWYNSLDTNSTITQRDSLIAEINKLFNSMYTVAGQTNTLFNEDDGLYTSDKGIVINGTNMGLSSETVSDKLQSYEKAFDKIIQEFNDSPGENGNQLSDIDTSGMDLDGPITADAKPVQPPVVDKPDNVNPPVDNTVNTDSRLTDLDYLPITITKIQSYLDKINSFSCMSTAVDFPTKVTGDGSLAKTLADDSSIDITKAKQINKDFIDNVIDTNTKRLNLITKPINIMPRNTNGITLLDLKYYHKYNDDYFKTTDKATIEKDFKEQIQPEYEGGMTFHASKPYIPFHDYYPKGLKLVEYNKNAIIEFFVTFRKFNDIGSGLSLYIMPDIDNIESNFNNGVYTDILDAGGATTIKNLRDTWDGDVNKANIQFFDDLYKRFKNFLRNGVDTATNTPDNTDNSFINNAEAGLTNAIKNNFDASTLIDQINNYVGFSAKIKIDKDNGFIFPKADWFRFLRDDLNISDDNISKINVNYKKESAIVLDAFNKLKATDSEFNKLSEDWVTNTETYIKSISDYKIKFNTATTDDKNKIITDISHELADKIKWLTDLKINNIFTDRPAYLNTIAKSLSSMFNATAYSATRTSDNYVYGLVNKNTFYQNDGSLSYIQLNNIDNNIQKVSNDYDAVIKLFNDSLSGAIPINFNDTYNVFQSSIMRVLISGKFDHYPADMNTVLDLNKQVYLLEESLSEMTTDKLNILKTNISTIATTNKIFVSSLTHSFDIYKLMDYSKDFELTGIINNQDIIKIEVKNTDSGRSIYKRSVTQFSKFEKKYNDYAIIMDTWDENLTKLLNVYDGILYAAVGIDHVTRDSYSIQIDKDIKTDTLERFILNNKSVTKNSDLDKTKKASLPYVRNNILIPFANKLAKDAVLLGETLPNNIKSYSNQTPPKVEEIPDITYDFFGELSSDDIIGLDYTFNKGAIQMYTIPFNKDVFNQDVITLTTNGVNADAVNNVKRIFNKETLKGKPLIVKYKSLMSDLAKNIDTLKCKYNYDSSEFTKDVLNIFGDNGDLFSNTSTGTDTSNLFDAPDVDKVKEDKTKLLTRLEKQLNSEVDLMKLIIPKIKERDNVVEAINEVIVNSLKEYNSVWKGATSSPYSSTDVVEDAKTSSLFKSNEYAYDFGKLYPNDQVQPGETINDLVISKYNDTLDTMSTPLQTSYNNAKSIMELMTPKGGGIKGDTPKVVENPDGSTTKTYPDGTIEVTHSNGDKEVTDPDGTLTETDLKGNEHITYPDGSTSATLYDGTKVSTNPDGSSVVTKTDGTVIVKQSDGTFTTTDPDGIVTLTEPDGTEKTTGTDGKVVTKNPTTITNPDGSITKTYPSGKVEVTYKDGSIKTTNPDGSEITNNADGIVDKTPSTKLVGTPIETTDDQGNKIETYPDGSTVTTDKIYGTVTTKYPDGRELSVNPDGSKTMMNPDFSSVETAVDGTVTTTKSGFLQIDNPDGSSRSEIHPGIMVNKDTDGNIIVRDLGKIYRYTAATGQVHFEMPNGDQRIIYPDGNTKTLDKTGKPIPDNKVPMVTDDDFYPYKVRVPTKEHPFNEPKEFEVLDPKTGQPIIDPKTQKTIVSPQPNTVAENGIGVDGTTKTPVIDPKTGKPIVIPDFDKSSLLITGTTTSSSISSTSQAGFGGTPNKPQKQHISDVKRLSSSESSAIQAKNSSAPAASNNSKTVVKIEHPSDSEDYQAEKEDLNDESSEFGQDKNSATNYTNNSQMGKFASNGQFLLTSTFIGIGMPPLYHKNDDIGYNKFFSKFGGKDGSTVQIRPVVINADKREKIQDTLKSYIKDATVSGDKNPYLNKINFKWHGFSTLRKLDQIRSAGIDEDIGHKAFMKRFETIVGYSSTIIAKNVIQYENTNQLTQLMSEAHPIGGKLDSISEAFTKLDEVYANPIKRLFNLTDSTGTKYNQGDEAVKYSNKMLLLCFDYVKRLTDSDHYLTFFANTDIDASDSFSSASKPLPEEYLNRIMTGLFSLADQIPGLGGALKVIGGEMNNKATGTMNTADQNANLGGLSQDKIGKNIGGKYTLEEQHQLGVNQHAFDVYQSSQFTKSLSLSIKLISPYADPRMIYLYVMVPYFILLTLALPQQIDQISTGNILYVQTDVPGKYSSDLGLITSFNRSNIAEYGYNSEGLPLAMQIDLSIQDLYNGFGLPTQSDAMLITPNFMSYLHTLLGFSREMDIGNFTTWIGLIEGYIDSIKAAIGMFIADKFGNFIRVMINGFTRNLDKATRSRIYNRDYDLRLDLGSITAISTRIKNSLNNSSLISMGFSLYDGVDGKLDPLLQDKINNAKDTKDYDDSKKGATIEVKPVNKTFGSGNNGSRIINKDSGTIRDEDFLNNATGYNT